MKMEFTKQFKRILMAFFAILILSGTDSIPQAQFGAPMCPYDNCMLVYTGRDQFCVGNNCLHLRQYMCGCCNRYIWLIAQ